MQPYHVLEAVVLAGMLGLALTGSNMCLIAVEACIA